VGELAGGRRWVGHGGVLDQPASCHESAVVRDGINDGPVGGQSTEYREEAVFYAVDSGPDGLFDGLRRIGMDGDLEAVPVSFVDPARSSWVWN
jgi:hypothetical protein